MKAISFFYIVLAGALFVSADAQAQESPYQLWQEDKTSPPVEDLYSQAEKFKNVVIPFQIRRRSEDRRQSTPKHEPLNLSGLELKNSYYYTKTATHRVSSGGYKTSFSVQSNEI